MFIKLSSNIVGKLSPKYRHVSPSGSRALIVLFFKKNTEAATGGAEAITIGVLMKRCF